MWYFVGLLFKQSILETNTIIIDEDDKQFNVSKAAKISLTLNKWQASTIIIVQSTNTTFHQGRFFRNKMKAFAPTHHWIRNF